MFVKRYAALLLTFLLAFVVCSCAADTDTSNEEPLDIKFADAKTEFLFGVNPDSDGKHVVVHATFTFEGAAPELAFIAPDGEYVDESESYITKRVDGQSIEYVFDNPPTGSDFADAWFVAYKLVDDSPVYFNTAFEYPDA